MNDYTVKTYGTDSSGRAIYMTVYMHDWWESVVKILGFRPTIVQGAFMVRNGGGAKNSDGAHDQGGSVDVRTWDLTKVQINKLVKVTRQQGAASWRRDKSYLHGGMDEHCHITLGSDSPLSSMAKTLWSSYLGDGDGLVGSRPDYEWRPKPLVTTPPEADLTTDELLAALESDRGQKALRKAVAYYVGDIVKDPDKPGNRIWVATALSRILQRTKK